MRVGGGPHRLAYLLASQLALILMAPFIAGDRPRPAVASALAVLVFVASVWAVGVKRRATVVAGLLAVPAIAGRIVTALSPGTQALAPAIVFGLIFIAYATALIFRRVVMTGEVTTETLYGAVAAYLMLGLFWGWSYALCEAFHPGSLRSTLSPDGRVAGPEFTFFSFITLTSVGYGDFVPVSAFARSLAILEAIAGQMYLAVFIARLVGKHGERRQSTSP